MIERHRGLVIDLDGTVYTEHGPIPGAWEAVEAVRAAGLPLRFATNTSRKPRSAVLEHLRGLGVAVERDEVLTAPLEASFLCMRLPAWHRSARKRQVKAPKLHFMDTDLACHLLGITEPDQLRRHPLRGALFESWVASEVSKWRLHRSLPARMFHYRETRGLEVDLLVEEGERLVAVEAKSAATVTDGFLKPLGCFCGEIRERQPHLEGEAHLVYGGSGAPRRSSLGTASTSTPGDPRDRAIPPRRLLRLR